MMRRVTVFAGKKSSTVTTVFLGDTELTFDADSLRRTLTRSHATPGGVPVASEEVVTTKGKAPGATAWTWLVADQQHSIRLAKGPGGVKRTAYLPHGTPLGYGTNPALAPGGRGYLNKTHDPNGDIRLDHRSYQPGLNVLTTPDALLTPYDPQGLNPYAYARNNPIGLSDPSGLLAADGTSRQDYCSECAISQVGTYDESAMGSGWEDGEWDALMQSLGARQPDAIDKAVFGALDFAGGFGSSARGTVTGAWSLGSDIVSSPFSDDARDRMGARGSALADMARHPIRTARGAWSGCMAAKARCAGGATFGVAAGLATGGASRLALAGRVGVAAKAGALTEREIGTTMDDLLQGANFLKQSKATQYVKPGGFSRANADFDALAQGVTIIERGGGLRTATLSNSTKINVRPFSSGKVVTLEVDTPGNPLLKVRYEQ